MKFFNKKCVLTLTLLFLSNSAYAEIFKPKPKLVLDGTKSVLNYVSPLLPKNAIILEAGGFNGVDTVKMATRWPGSTIYTFEPVPENFDKLKKNCETFKNVFCFQLALAEKNSTAEFHISEYAAKPGVPTASGSLLPPQDHLKHDQEIIFPKTITVPTQTLDTWAKTNNIDRIDFMWLDMQGYELPMLKSGTNVLATVKLIYTEVEFVKAYKDQPIYADVKAWLQTQGFEVLALDFNEELAFKKEFAPKDRYFGNALFISKTYKNQIAPK